ncbi:MAG: DUF309 domain-containing protein [Sulfitobacter sp.]
MPDQPVPVPLPPHAYIPGQNRRHPEDLFDAIKRSVDPDLPLADLQHTEAFRAGLIYLESGFFWECHEVLEAVWLRTPKGTPERELVQALIQLANAHLKVLMGRPRAAKRLCDMVEGHLQNCDGAQPILGLKPESVSARVEKLRQRLQDK